MIKFFKSRKPLATLIIAALLSPEGGMLYLGKGRLAVIYLIASIIAAILGFVAWFYNFRILSATDQISVAQFCVYIVGIIHCYRISLKGNPQPEKWYARWYYVVLLIVVFPLLLAFLFRAFVYQPFDMPSKSMEPTINYGDYFFVKKFGDKSYMRGDIIVFKSFDKNGEITFFVKRLIGLPGDKVEYNYNVLLVNGKNVEELCEDVDSLRLKCTEISQVKSTYYIHKDKNDFFSGRSFIYNVPEDAYFVLGDNRSNSVDSRFPSVGFVPAEKITGKVVYDFWINELGKVEFKKF